jgi:hypothetical protein
MVEHASFTRRVYDKTLVSIGVDWIVVCLGFSGYMQCSFLFVVAASCSVNLTEFERLVASVSDLSLLHFHHSV